MSEPGPLLDRAGASSAVEPDELAEEFRLPLKDLSLSMAQPKTALLPVPATR
jgi:hypothetical protein